MAIASSCDAPRSLLVHRRDEGAATQSGSRNNITDRPVMLNALDAAVALPAFLVKFYSPLVNRETVISD
jgi:hypothetical protein